MNAPEGHRERLRQKFRRDPASLSETEELELLLTYAIPRRDVSPIAENLISHFGSLKKVLGALDQELIPIDGVGESVITFLHLLDYLVKEITHNPVTENSKSQAPTAQLNLFELGSEQFKKVVKKSAQGVNTRAMRVFANDEIVNSLNFLPQVGKFQSLEDFKRYLQEKLPYNAAETRQRRANNIVERFYPENDINTPLTYFVTHCTADVDLKPAVFYHVLKAEPIATKVADEFIWPALPIGHIEREQLREFVLRYLPHTKVASQAKIIQAIFHTYDLLGIGSVNDTTLRFQLRQGSLESFLYILISEFHEPGIYSFDSLYGSPLHHWLLWDREWMRMQLYNLQDFGILSKVSEIDTMRQFTLAVDQRTALRQFFEHPARSDMAIRETAKSQSAGQED